MAWGGAFSRTRRPLHTAGPPPGPGTKASTSTPFGITAAATVPRHARAIARLTATKVLASPANATADSSQGTGGVCSVEIVGIGRAGAMATGRGGGLLVWAPAEGGARTPRLR